MANYLNLNDVKKHLNIDDYFTDDDLYLEALMNVAEKVVEKHIDIGLDIVAGYNGGELPSPLIHAMLLFIANMYANRESVAFASASEIPLSYQYILDLYKCYNPSNYVLVMNIIDNLTSKSTTDALSANQGRILKELIDSINVEVDLTNYYTKLQTDALMTTKSDTTHTHVIGQVADLQAELDAKANVSDLPDVSHYMTETTADNKYQPKGDYATTNEIPDVSGFMTRNEMSDYAAFSDIPTSLSELENDCDFVNSTYVGNITNAKLNIAVYNRDKETFATKDEIPDVSGLATKAELNNALGAITTKLDTINGEEV